jgi:VRR-NUC domain-containing protein
VSPRTEGQLLDATIDLATRCRWAVHHDRPARTAHGWRTAIQGHAGFPDLVLARAGLVLFRELKGPRGRLSSEQRDWAKQLDPDWPLSLLVPGVGEVRTSPLFDVWTPNDWDTLIVPTLTAKQPALAR